MTITHNTTKQSVSGGQSTTPEKESWMNKEEVGLAKDAKIIHVAGIKSGKNKKIVDLVKSHFHTMQPCLNFYKTGTSCNISSGNPTNPGVNFLLADHDVNRLS